MSMFYLNPLPLRAKRQNILRPAIFIAASAVFSALMCCAPPASAQVLFQQFYYPIDNPPAPTSWWQQAARELPALSRLGVHAIWHPVPVKGGSGAQSMGYDPYDLYDLGSKDQRDTVPTRFGTKDAYLAYIATAHANGLRVYADVVLNHTGGADQAEENPLMAQLGWDDIADDSKVPAPWRPPGYDPATMNLRSWTLYRPKGADGKPGSGRFPRNWKHFHPSAAHPNRDEPYQKNYFLEDFCTEAENNYVGRNLVAWGGWFRAQTGVDGFRLDAVKHAEPSFVNRFGEAVTRTPTVSAREPFFLVGEFWETNAEMLGSFQKATGRRMSLFDFGLYYAMRDMVMKPGEFDMRDVLKRRFADRERAVMFVSNHDVDRDSEPMPRQKRTLPYAMTLCLSGRPSIFYLDYFKPDDKTLPETLKRLIPVHNRFAKGTEVVRFADADLLVIERAKSLLAAFNDGGADGSTARTVAVPTGFGAGVKLKAIGNAPGTPFISVTTNAKGEATLTVPGGGYLLLIRADATEKTFPDRFTRRSLPTTQITEFADDLDTGRLGPDPQRVSVTAAAGSEITARLEGGSLRDVGALLLELRDPSGKTIARATGRRGKPLLLRRRVKASGVYHLHSAAPGDSTKARIAITYTAPR